MSTAEILLKAAELIEPEGAWTTGCEARLPKCEPTYGANPSAACWCAYGAMARIANSDPPAFREAISALSAHIGIGTLSIGTWNDTRTQAEVVAALRAAAKSVGAES